MQTLIQIFGQGKDLSVLQMCARGIAVFIITLILLRISGRRSFGVRTSLDNIIVVLIGAILSRAITGASPFAGTIITSLIIVLIHRGLAYLMIHFSFINRLIEGDKILLFDNSSFKEKNMNKGLVCKEDVMQGVRKTALTDSMEKIEKVFIERNGEISVVKKDE